VVIEVHPEVSFAELAGRPLAYPKSTWAGAEERRGLLRSAGIHVPIELGPPGALAAVDDVLDAAAVCWTAGRYAEGTAFSVPPEPERFEDGVTAAIWV
jgi:predicted RNase H-like nuclease